MTPPPSPARRRPAFAPSVVAVWGSSWTSPWAWLLIVVCDVWLGTTYVTGGPERLSSPSFAGLRLLDGPVVALVPGADTGDAAGGLFVAAALVVALAPFVGRRTLAAGNWTLVALHLLLFAGFVVALSREPIAPPYPPPPPLLDWPRVSTSALPTYAFITGAHLINAAVLGRLGPAGKAGGRG